MSKKLLVIALVVSFAFVAMSIVYTKLDRQSFESEFQAHVKPIESYSPIQKDVQNVTVEAKDETIFDEMDWDSLVSTEQGVIDTVSEDHPLYGLTVEEAKVKLDGLMREVEESIPMLDNMIRENKELLANLPDLDSGSHDMNHPVFAYARSLMASGATLEDLQSDPEFVRLSNDMTNQLTGVDDILEKSIERQAILEEELSKPLPKSNEDIMPD